MKYLGCVITHIKKRKEHCNELLVMVKNKLQSSKDKMLSYRVRRFELQVCFKVLLFMWFLLLCLIFVSLKSFIKVFLSIFGVIKS